MTTEQTPLQTMPTLNWPPHNISAISVERKGLIGRATCFQIGGVDVVVLCRTEADLQAVYERINENVANVPLFDPALVERSTLISSAGVEVIVADDVTDVAPKPTDIETNVASVTVEDDDEL